MTTKLARLEWDLSDRQNTIGERDAQIEKNNMEIENLNSTISSLENDLLSAKQRHWLRGSVPMR